MTSTAPDNVYVTKLAAARRQLLEAIRMFFAGQDELAVHTVASAAYRIIADLKEKRGRDEAGDFFLTAVFFVVQDYRRGTLPKHLASDPQFMKSVREMADQIPITASTKYEEIEVRLPPAAKKRFWTAMNRASNFLKHADRDSTASLSLAKFDNLLLLVLAFGSYRDLVQGAVETEWEGFVLSIYFSTMMGHKEGLPEGFQRIAAKLEVLPHAEGLSLCSALLESLNMDGHEDTT